MSPAMVRARKCPFSLRFLKQEPVHSLWPAWHLPLEMIADGKHGGMVFTLAQALVAGV